MVRPSRSETQELDQLEALAGMAADQILAVGRLWIRMRQVARRSQKSAAPLQCEECGEVVQVVRCDHCGAEIVTDQSPQDRDLISVVAPASQEMALIADRADDIHRLLTVMLEERQNARTWRERGYRILD